GYQVLAEKMGATQEQLDQSFKNQGGPEVVNKYEQVNKAIEKTKTNLTQLRDILARQTAEEEKARKDPEKELTTRQITTMQKAQETIRDTKAKYEALFQSPAQKDFLTTQEDITHSIEGFKENLERAEIPADKMKKLVADYSAEIRKLKEGELIL